MWLRAGGALLLLVVAVGVFNYLRPIPPATAKSLVPSSQTIPGTAPAIPWPARGSGAVAVSGLGAIGSSGNEQAVSTASVAKVMTALVVLTDHPLQPGQAGDTITFTEADVQSYITDTRGGQSTVPVRSGEQMTELQALQAMLIPSGNNIAETLARWDSGSIPAFVTKMNARAASLHLASTRFADTSGADPATVSTPTDLVVLGMEAMKLPVFAQVVAMPQVELPVAGRMYNVDAALGQDGILGIKTGSGLSSGANFLFAASVAVDGHQLTVYGCVMGQPTLGAAFESAKALVHALAGTLHVRRALEKNQSVATYTTAWGQSTDLVSSVDLDLVEWPGMVVRARVTAGALVVDRPVAASTREGTLHVVLGDYALDLPLVTSDPLYPPGRLWRLTRVNL